MNYRTAELLAPEDLGASGTKVIDIDVQKPISRIEIRWRTTRATEGQAAGAPADITKVEIVDGSKRLVSATGYELQALGYYNRPGSLFSHSQMLNGNSGMTLIPIDFGRELWDELLAFDPTKFTNPQLRITYDEDVSDTSVTVNEMEILAHIFDEKVVSPVGFLSAIEHFDYTLGADNSFETVELPQDRVIRQMLVRAFQSGYEPWYSIDEARFDEGTLDKIAFEYTNLEKFARMMKATWKPIIFPIQGHADTVGVVFFTPNTDYWSGFKGNQQSGTASPYVDAASGRGGKITVKAASDIDFDGQTMGYLPWHCYQFPMGKKDDIEDWYDPAGKKPRLRLRASTGATSSTGQVVLEELYRY